MRNDYGDAELGGEEVSAGCKLVQIGSGMRNDYGDAELEGEECLLAESADWIWNEE